MKPQVKRWLEFAQVDLLSAEKLLNDDRLTQSVSFHCHQAIEKSFKAFLENISGKVPKIHDLERLYGMIKEYQIELDLDYDLLDQVNDVYIDSRYPPDVGLVPEGRPSIEKTKKFYELAKHIYELIYQKCI